eukprot:8217838-Alexandrium_andersonii.AAC.1
MTPPAGRPPAALLPLSVPALRGRAAVSPGEVVIGVVDWGRKRSRAGSQCDHGQLLDLLEGLLELVGGYPRAQGVGLHGLAAPPADVEQVFGVLEELHEH